MDAVKQGFGKILKDLRRVNNLTQEKLAEMIGVNIRQLARIEAGESFVTSDTIINICTALDITPKQLFNFEIESKYLKTGTGNKLYFSAIKSGNIIKILNDNIKNENISQDKNTQTELDLKMQITAKRLNKEIIVDEIVDGNVSVTKTYLPSGEVIVDEKNKNNKQFNELKAKIIKISNDKRKIKFLSLAIDSLTNAKALKELKSLIKGIELTYEDDEN